MNAPLPRIQMRDIVKSFGSVRVLEGVSLDVMPREIVALLGANGAGKSTLMKILAANYTKNSGEIRVNDQVVSFNSPRDAAEVGITFLPQEISVFPELSIAENGDKGMVDWSDMARRAQVVLDDLGFGHLSVDTLVADLPVAERRIIKIARALDSRADIPVMDELTASLSKQEANRFSLYCAVSKSVGQVSFTSRIS